jgi:hypothetical protein
VKCVGTVGTFVSFADETSEDEKREAREETLGPFPSLSLSLFFSLSLPTNALFVSFVASFVRHFSFCVFLSVSLSFCLSVLLSFSHSLVIGARTQQYCTLLFKPLKHWAF